MNGNGNRRRRSLDSFRIDAQRDAIRNLDLRSALEFYGVRFGQNGVALCPFHTEKIGSFRVKDNFWHCFGCNESGDLITFARKKFGGNYTDTVEMICRDFRIITAEPTIADMERLDFLKLERYDKIKKYDALLSAVDDYTELLLIAEDMRDYAVEFCGGKSPDNELYISAQFAVLAAQMALEQAETVCKDYLKENPSATIVPPTKPNTAVKCVLPPAPAPAGEVTLQRNDRTDFDCKEISGQERGELFGVPY